MIRTKDLIWGTLAVLSFIVFLCTLAGCSERRGLEWHPNGREVNIYRYCMRHHQGIHLPNDEILEPASEIADAR